MVDIFFFQAEDGIRDYKVTGVQTCALPISTFGGAAPQPALYGATLLRAIDWALNPVTRVEVSGPRGQGRACDMHLLALQTHRPRKVVVRKPAERPAAPAATVCVGTTCSLPVATPEEIGRARVGKECRSRWSPYH